MIGHIFCNILIVVEADSMCEQGELFIQQDWTRLDVKVVADNKLDMG